MSKEYELDFVAEKCLKCGSFKWGNAGRGLCLAEKCTKPPLMSIKELLKDWKVKKETTIG